MKNLRIEKTGNFWIDNGIVGLYRILSHLEYDANCEISAGGLELSFENEDTLIDVLNKARNEVVSKFLKKTGNFGWIYNNNLAFEVYERTDFKMHLKPFFTGKTPKTEGALLVPESKDSELGGKGRRMTPSEYQNFLKFKEDNVGKIEKNKKLKIENKGFLNTPPSGSSQIIIRTGWDLQSHLDFLTNFQLAITPNKHRTIQCYTPSTYAND